MKTITFLLIAILLNSCAHFPDGGSVWSGGLWIIPWITGLGSAWSFYRAYKQWVSGSKWVETDASGSPVWKTSKKRVPLYKIGAFVFGGILFIATVVVIIMVNSDK